MSFPGNHANELVGATSSSSVTFRLTVLFGGLSLPAGALHMCGQAVGNRRIELHEDDVYEWTQAVGAASQSQCAWASM